MRLSIKWMAISTLSLAMTSAFAAESTTMNVKGGIFTSSCEISAGGVDFIHNDINTATLSPTEYNPTGGAYNSNIKVTCERETSIAVEVIDDYKGFKGTDKMPFNRYSTVGGGTLDPDQYHALIDSDTNQAIGGYAVYFVEKDLGGRALLHRTDDSSDWSIADSYIFDTTRPHIAIGNFRNFPNPNIPNSEVEHIFPYAVVATLFKSGDLPQSRDITMKGSTTFVVKYL